MRPGRIVKFFIIFFIAILLIVSASAALLITFFPKESLMALVTEQAEAALKRKVSVKNISYGLGGVTLEDVVIHESRSDNSPVLASSQYADLRPSFFSLLTLDIEFDSVSLQNAACNIVFDDKGVSNIQKLMSDLSQEGDGGVSAKISQISLTNASVTLENPPKFLAPLAGTYIMTAKVRLQKKIKITGCSLKLPQARGKIHAELVIEPLDDDFKVSGSVSLDNVSILWVYQWGDNLALPYNIINGKATDLEITKRYAKGMVSTTSTLLNTNKLLRADGSCHVDLDAGTVLIRRTKGSVDNSSFFLDSLGFTFGGKLLGFNVKNINASLSDMMPLVKFIPPKLFGALEGNLSFSDGLYNGAVVLKDWGWDPETKMLSGLQTSLTITDNIFKKTDIPFKFYGNPCLLSIASTERSLLKLFINLSSDTITIDLDKNKFSASNEPLNLPLEISGIININQFSYHPYRINNVQLQYVLSGDSFNIKGFQFLFANGKISGKGSVSFPQGPSRASLSLNFNNLLVQDVISANEKIRNRFFGVLQGNSKVDFELSERILETARGNAEFTISKGKLVDTGIQNGLGIILSELKYKLRDLEFNKIYGNIDIRGTTYYIKSFIFNSNDIRMKVTGSFDRNFIASPLNIGLEFTRAFIQDLPNASVIVLNRYLRGEWYLVPFIMSGDMTESKNIRRLD